MIDAGGTVSILKPNAEEMTAHVQHLFGDCLEGVVELAWYDPNRKALDKGEMFALDRLDELVEKAVLINSQPGFNVYIGAALRKPGTFPMGRANDEDYFCTVAYYVDLDDPGVAEAAGQKLQSCKPTFAVLTGLRPHARASLWWKLETPIYDAQQHATQIKALTAHFNGDPVVFNPSRVMRLGGSVAWPKKDGRVLEMTQVVKFTDGRQMQMMAGQVERAYPIALQSIQGTLDPERSPISGRLSTSRLMEGITNGALWHKRMVQLTGNWINRGFTDDEILAMAEHLTLSGWTHDQTRREVAAAVQSGRQKWNIPSPVIEISDAPEIATAASEPKPASSYTGIAPEREWIIQDWIPALTITSLYGDGGMGKTLLAQQLGTSCVTGVPWLGLQAAKMPVLAVLCEDDDDELHRRQSSINIAAGTTMHPGLDHLLLWSRVGHENILVNFDQKNVASPTPFFTDLDSRLAAYGQPHLLILDNVADIFGGNEIIRAQVNAFIKSWLGRWVKQYQTTILLLAHPSAAGKTNGSGFSGSTAWNNAVRSRLYLDRPEDMDSSQRVLKRLKANYAASGNDQKLDIVWESGLFTTQPRKDTVDQIEHRAMKNQILYCIGQEWDAGRPLGGSRSGRKVREVLPGLLRNYDRGQIMKAFAELERDGFVSTQHGDSHKRGYKVMRSLDDQ
jgi:hypothetical protein